MMNTLLKAAGTILLVFIIVLILVRMSEELPVLLIAASVGGIILNFWMVPGIIDSLRRRFLTKALVSATPLDLKHFLYASAMVILCQLFLLAPMLSIVYGDNHLDKKERQWQAYVKKAHCVFVASEKVDEGPLSTWQCDDGMHQVNIAVHQTKQGIAIGRDITALRYFSYALSALYIVASGAAIWFFMRQYRLAKQRWRQTQSGLDIEQETQS